MADSTLIPPVGSSTSLPKSRSVPASKEKLKRPPKQPTLKKPKDDNGRPGIDEYA